MGRAVAAAPLDVELLTEETGVLAPGELDIVPPVIGAAVATAPLDVELLRIPETDTLELGKLEAMLLARGPTVTIVP